jgi:pimeloyl-ACP methyl ester carboxylesterase
MGFAAGIVAGCAASPPGPARPPIVLVHGAWMGASSWDKVAADLRARGHAVTAVELPGHGKDETPPDQLSLDGYIAAVIGALPADGKAVLVGHSMAGMVISGAAEKAPARIGHLVYVAAYLPRDGESLYQLSQTDRDSHVGKYWFQENPQAYSPASIRSEGIVEVFCADCSAADQAALIAAHRPEAIAPLGTPLRLSVANFGSVPRTYVHTRHDNAVSYTLQKAMLANAGGAARVHELDSSHLPMLARSAALADIIAAAAQ